MNSQIEAYNGMGVSKISLQLVSNSYIFWKENTVPHRKSAKNRKDASNVLQWYTICSVFLQNWIIKFISGKDDELTLPLAFLNNPTRVGYLVFKEFVQG